MPNARAAISGDPSRFNPAAHLRLVPFTFACGARWVGEHQGTVELSLPFSNAVRDAASGGVDARAIMGLLDHASSAAVYAALRRPVGIATLDLRVALQRAAPPATDVTVTARATHIDEGVAFVAASAHAGSGAALAMSTASFIVGSAPGRTVEGDGGMDLPAHRWQPARAFDTGDVSKLSSFEEFLGLARHGQHVRMEFSDRLIGAISLPALHGGSVAALLATVARELAASDGGKATRLAAIGVQYLRAARDEATSSSAVFEKRGARSAVISALAKQAHGSREVARAQCIFVTG